jgi:hypothetical protein
MWQEVFMPISILGSFGASLYFFTKVLTDYMLRKRMVDKGYVGEEAQSIFKNYNSESKYASLKWGLLFLSGGIAFILMHVIDVRPDTPLPYGIFTVSLSLGFLIYYFLVKRELPK